MYIIGNPAGLIAVLMASAVVVLNHETSTLRQSHNFKSIHFKFGMGDNVREVTNPDKFGSVPMNGRNATWGNIYGSCVFFYFVFSFFILQQSYSPYP